jgi:nitrogen fixation protein
MSKVIDSEGNIKVTGLGSVISQVITDGVTDKAPSENAVFDALALKANSADLATVATSGDYNDLSNLPSIPAAQVNADWNATSGVAEILNKPTIPSVTGFVPYTGATADLDMGTHNVTADHISLNVSPSGAGFVVGSTQWNNTIGSSETLLKGGNVTLKNGVDLVARIVNKVTPNTTLTKANYQAVRVSGAQGGRLAINLAQANNDINSADTIGLVTETIATNQEGFIITVGQLENINTTGSLQGETWVDGDVLYLSPTTAGRLTNIKPTGAGHIVVIGYVEYAHAINGKIYVKIMNGWELDELHDVAITSVADNNLLQYDSATSLWKNESLSTAGIQPTLTSGTNIKTINGNSLLGSGDLVVGGGITVGTTAVTSGTVGRVFFQGAGNVVQQSGSLFWDNTNARLGVGATPATSVRLDVRAQGTLSTDIAFRVRNSADTQNLLSSLGNGEFLLHDGAYRKMRIEAGNDGSVLIGTSHPAVNIAAGDIAMGNYAALGTNGNRRIVIGRSATNNGYEAIAIGSTSNNQADYGIAIGRSSATASGGAQIAIGLNMATAGNSAIMLGVNLSGVTTNNIANSFALSLANGAAGNTQHFFVNSNTNIVMRSATALTTGTHYNSTATNTITIHNGTATSTNIVDAYQQYSADIAAGNAAPHFRTENGNIIKLYQQSSAGITTVGQLVTVLQNLGLLS